MLVVVHAAALGIGEWDVPQGSLSIPVGGAECWGCWSEQSEQLLESLREGKCALVAKE